MDENWFDLHLHSYFSDGRLSPEDLIRECKRVGMKIVALTDHESIKGIPWAISEGKRLGIKVIPGIEFSADFNGKEHHFLGIAIDYRAPELSDFIKKWEDTKKQQIAQMVEGLQALGFQVSLSDVMAQSCGALNRAHIAYAVQERRENNAIMRKYGLKTSSDFFLKFLKEENSIIYVKRKMPSAVEVIQLIKLLGGQAVWAHPFWKKESAKAIEERAAYFCRLGLAGLEVCYSNDYQSPATTIALHQLAQEFSMLETGGSDFHSFEMPFLNKIANFEQLDIELNLPEECWCFM